jgi:malonyl-CoA O-methyltransferase
MFDTHRIRQDFSRAATEYNQHTALQEQVLGNLLARAGSLLSSAHDILDAGCGTGRLAKLLPSCKVTQLDMAYAMCKEASVSGIAINGTVESLPFADGSFDAIVSSLVLQWVADRQGAMCEMLRVLKSGGALAVSCFADGTLEELKESFASGDRYPHVSWFPPESEFQDSEIVTEYYPDLKSLMKHLKIIGARNKLLNRRKSLMTARQLQAVEAHYREHFGTASGLPVTWKIGYSVIRKP